ncbi:MAG: DUF1835 domain-containing protein [Bacteroidota bacterium]
MLHVTNGDIAAGLLKECNFPGDILPWRDVLHEGPVPASEPAELRRVRAEFIASCGWAEFHDVLKDFAERDEALNKALLKDGEIVLWFEHDVYDQLQLAQIFHQISLVPVLKAKISLIQTNDFIPQFSCDDLKKLFKNRETASQNTIELFKKTWLAFTSDDFKNLFTLLHEEDFSDVPFLEEAIIRLIEELPSTENGLTRTEEEIVKCVLQSEKSIGEVFKNVQESEAALYLGDTSFATYVERISHVQFPLLKALENMALTPLKENPETFWAQKITATEHGESVLKGESHHGELNGIDRWLGGTRIIHKAGDSL